MPTLLIDMPSGVAGDMLFAALLGCGGDLDRVRQDLLALGLGPIAITATPVNRGGLAALLVDVEADQHATWTQDQPLKLIGATPATVPSASPHQQSAISNQQSPVPHRPYRVIRDLITAADLPARVTDRAQRAFRLLAEAEAEVHGTTADAVEFHEVGAVDAIADVVGCCLLLEQLGIDRVVASPVLPGHGIVHCAHGRMPVPVPAVAAMLRRTHAPCRTLSFDSGELTTPTGCALVCALADAFIDGGINGGAVPGTWRMVASGYGAGHKEIPRLVNVVRVLVLDSCSLESGSAQTTDRPSTTPSRHDAQTPDPRPQTPDRGNEAQTPDPGSRTPDRGNHIVEIRTQLDDATGEQLAVLADQLLAAGALDVFMTAVAMKKGRPGTLLTVLCAPADRTRMSHLILSGSPAIGLRWQEMPRDVLPRRAQSVEVEGHAIPLKIVTLPDGTERAKPEADAVARTAAIIAWPFNRVAEAALAHWRADPGRAGPAAWPGGPPPE